MAAKGLLGEAAKRGASQDPLAAPLGFLRHRSGSFDVERTAGVDGVLLAAEASEAAGDATQMGSQTLSALHTKEDFAVAPTLGIMPQQPPEIEEGNLEYKFVLAPESAGEKLRGVAGCATDFRTPLRRAASQTACGT